MTNSKPRSITPRYGSLPLISLLLKLFGFLLLGFAVAIFLFGVFAMISRGSLEGLGLFVGQLVGGIIFSVLLIAVSELIHVFMDIEDHTRRLIDHATGKITGTTPRISGDGDDT